LRARFTKTCREFLLTSSNIFGQIAKMITTDQ
jgi:hypothetical protein